MSERERERERCEECLKHNQCLGGHRVVFRDTSSGTVRVLRGKGMMGEGWRVRPTD